MAEEFNFNYHYLSAYFHQHMKEGFSDFFQYLTHHFFIILLVMRHRNLPEILIPLCIFRRIFISI